MKVLLCICLMSILSLVQYLLVIYSMFAYVCIRMYIYIFNYKLMLIYK